ncbi:hypothetical protein AB3S75_028250 [Citrus x aurantiifolia]
MLVLSMNSKRQRRPNVRLGEVGDVPAAFACGFSQKSSENLGLQRWKHDFVNHPEETGHNLSLGFSEQKSSEFTVTDPEHDPGVSPRNSADLQQNMENKNPNSSKLAFETVNSDIVDGTNSALDFGTVTRKSRVMKRRSRSSRVKSNVFGSAWNSKLSPQFSSEEAKECGGKEIVGFTSNACDGYYPENVFKDFSDRGTPATSKEACVYEVEETTYDAWQPGNSNDCWKDDACYEENDAFIKSGIEWNATGCGGTDVNTVKRWLEELGFGKYAGMFEMHEVDEETLPLLTLEDLKEMGVFAVGPRRKLYNAIQQLRGEDVSA